MAEGLGSIHERFALAVATTVVLVPVVVIAVPWAEPGGIDDFNRRVTLQLFDVGVLASAVLGAAIVWEQRRRFRWSWAAAPGAALGAWYVLAVAVNPNWRGVELLLRLATLGLVALAATTLDRHLRNGIMATTVVVAALQAILGLAQSATGAVLGFGPLEFEGFLYPFGDDIAGRGGLTHPYHLAVFLLVGLGAAVADDDEGHRRLLVAASAVIGLGLACTFSRAAIIALAGAVLVAVVRRRRLRRSHGWVLAAATFGFAAGVLVFSSGWLARAEVTTTGIEDQAAGGAGAALDSGRRQLVRDAIELVEEHPFTGVGPGRYVTALDEELDVPPLRRLPPHDVVVHVAAEAGLPAAVLLLAGAAILARAVWRRSAPATVALALLLPYFLLDAYPYSFPAGLAVLAIPAVAAAGRETAT